jgi:hypothetical protein
MFWILGDKTVEKNESCLNIYLFHINLILFLHLTKCNVLETGSISVTRELKKGSDKDSYFRHWTNDCFPHPGTPTDLQIPIPCKMSIKLYLSKHWLCYKRLSPITVAARSSLARTLGSWVRIPLMTRMSVCVFILCLCCRVCRYVPCDELIPRPRSPTVCVKKIKKLKKRPTKDCRAIDEWMNKTL